MMGSAFNRARRAPCTSEDLAASVAWGEPVELAAVEARLLGAAPVCFNGARWMAVDEDGRGFVVHVERVPGQTAGMIRVVLHVFDVADPSMLHVTQTLDPGRVFSALAAPCIAISSGSSETRFTITFIGKAWGAATHEYLYLASGCVSRPRPGRLVSPVVRIYDILELHPPYNNLSNPSIFMDNDESVHLAYTAQPTGGPLQVPVVVYMSAAWSGDPNTWRWRRRELGGTVYDASNASVAARWSDGQLVVVVACKIIRSVVEKAGSYDLSGVYCNVATGSTILSWGGWTFLSGVDVLAGAAGNANSLNAADPSVWVNGDAAFCVGYHERELLDTNRLVVQPFVATNSAPGDASSPWKWHPIGTTEPFGHFVCVSGNGMQGFCVWEARPQNVQSPARWEAAISALQDATSSTWIGLDPTLSWGLTLNATTGRDMLLFPTSCMLGKMLYVAWFYVDRTQGNQDNPLDSVLSWPSAPVGAVVSIRMLSGEVACL